MSAFHHRCRLLAKSEGSATYRFYPDYMDKPDLYGVFVVDLRTQTVTVLEETGHHLNDRAISALVHKIRKICEAGKPVPSELGYTA